VQTHPAHDAAGRIEGKSNMIPKSARLRMVQYGVVAQISVICMINYIDRTTLAIANPAIRGEMGLSLSQMGLLLSAFPLTYALSQLPLGPVIDRLGSRWLLGTGLAIWSVAQGLAGLAASPGQLWACRILLGVGEAPTLPSCTKVVRRWFTVSERGKPVGIFTGANHLGQVIAAPVLTVMLVVMGWRWMFAIMGILGIICVAVWFAYYRDPADANLSESDIAHLAEGETLHDAPPMNFGQWWHLYGFRTS
jgi:MFS family permease